MQTVSSPYFWQKEFALICYPTSTLEVTNLILKFGVETGTGLIRDNYNHLIFESYMILIRTGV